MARKEDKEAMIERGFELARRLEEELIFPDQLTTGQMLICLRYYSRLGRVFKDVCNTLGLSDVHVSRLLW